nr:prepilin-type N-terminal cleavage/methylation domain-containing protein [Pelagicoccus albus]
MRLKARIVAKEAFSLIEVIVALAMLALIAIPAVGLATMAVGQSKAQLTVGKASALKTKIDVALRALDTIGSFDILTAESNLTGVLLEMMASEDLRYIESSGGGYDAENDQYYRILVKEPENYDYDSTLPYRLVVYEVSWPNNSEDEQRNQMHFSSVFRK